MSLKFTILGMLMGRPLHGYDLKRFLSPGLPPNRRVNDGVLYPLLKKMESEGLIRKELVRVGNTPERHLVHPTRKGEDTFFAWLQSDSFEEDEVKYNFFLGHPFLSKLLFFERLDAAEILKKLTRQREFAIRKREEFQRIRGGMIERDVSLYRIAILDLGTTQNEEKVRWLERLIEDLKLRGDGKKTRH